MNPMKDTNLRKLRVAVVEAVVGVVQRKDIGEVMIVSQSQKALHLVSSLDHISVLDFDILIKGKSLVKLLFKPLL